MSGWRVGEVEGWRVGGGGWRIGEVKECVGGGVEE